MYDLLFKSKYRHWIWFGGSILIMMLLGVLRVDVNLSFGSL